MPSVSRTRSLPRYIGRAGGDVWKGLQQRHIERGQRKLFTTADGIERLWEVAAPLLENSPKLEFYEPGTYGPDSVRELIAPRRWRLPFERKWRD